MNMARKCVPGELNGGLCCCNKLLAFQLNLYPTFIVLQYSPCLASDEGDIVCCSREVQMSITYGRLFIHSLSFPPLMAKSQWKWYWLSCKLMMMMMMSMLLLMSLLYAAVVGMIVTMPDTKCIPWLRLSWLECGLTVNERVRACVCVWMMLCGLGLLSASQLIALRYITLTLHFIRI